MASGKLKDIEKKEVNSCQVLHRTVQVIYEVSPGFKQTISLFNLFFSLPLILTLVYIFP